MENNTTLNEKVNGIMEEAYKKMSMSETCDVLLEQIKEKYIIFTNDENNATDIRKVLSESQMENIKQIVLACIRDNKKDSDDWLEQFVQFNPEEKKKKFADGQDEEPVENKEEDNKESVKENKKKKEIELDKKKVQELLDKGMIQKEIAKELGVSQGTVQRFIAKNGLKKRKASTPS